MRLTLKLSTELTLELSNSQTVFTNKLMGVQYVAHPLLLFVIFIWQN